MKIIFMGTPLFASIAFDSLCEGFGKCDAKEKINQKCEILRVVTQADKPVGRKGIITPPPMKQKALEQGIEVLQPDRLDAAFAKILRDLEPDFIVVVAYGKILPKEILEIAPCINLHASILPKYRGASPIQQMILSDDSEYGISIMRMEEGLDSGGILSVKKIPRNDENYVDLSARLARNGGVELARVLIDFRNITPILQDEREASYCQKLRKNDGEVRFIDAQKIYKKSLAFMPWPSVFLPNGIKLFGIKVVEKMSCEKSDILGKNGAKKAGEILSISPVIVACENGAVEIDELQAPSKNKMRASEFLTSRAINIGDNLLEII
ncbi:methionyl-tRNA formyltransferase [Helicobacter sp. T3_23-1056]